MHTYVSYFALNFLNVENKKGEWQGHLCCLKGALTHVGNFKSEPIIENHKLHSPKSNINWEC